MEFKLIRYLSNMENFISLVNNELGKLGYLETIEEGDIDITSPEVISDGELNTKVVITNKVGKNKLSRPINFLYKRVSIHEQLEIDDPEENQIIMRVKDDIWIDEEMDETNAEVILSEQLDYDFQSSCFDLKATKVNEYRYDVLQTSKTGLDNLLYTGSITWIIVKEGSTADNFF